MNLKPIICPSMLSSDFSQLGKEASRMLQLGADWLHLDLMDGHFVPNLTIGPPVVASLHKHLPQAFLDCHCMVSDPLMWVQPLAKAGATQLTFHTEAVADDKDFSKLVHTIRDAGMKVGVTLKPGTDLEPFLERIKEVVSMISTVLVMTVEPGFGGQAFMSDQMDKVRRIRGLYPSLDIQVDGGLGPDTITEAAEAGANVIVAGSSIFKADDPGAVISLLRESVKKSIGN